MRSLFTWILLLHTAGISLAQTNMVPNGNFEVYTTCPTSWGQVSHCDGWNDYNSSDYFNACSQSQWSVPVNNWGYQYAASGNGYMGGVVWSSNASSPLEYVWRSIVPLQAGYPYSVSLSVSVANSVAVGSNVMGVYFFSGASFVPPTAAQVEWPGTIVADTQGWVRLSKILIADSAYNKVAIGGFKPGNQATTAAIRLPMPSLTYYYFDSIVVKPADSLLFDTAVDTICGGDTFSQQYLAPYSKAANNSFTIQLSDASGSFTAPVTIGSKNTNVSGSILCTVPVNTPTGTGYKIRLIASHAPDTLTGTVPIVIGNPAKPNIVVNTPVCAGQTLQLYGVTQLSPSWTGPNGFNSSTLNPTLSNSTTAMSGQYILTASIYGCTNSDTETVVVNPSLQPITASVQSLICAGDTIQLSASNTSPGGASYSWTGPGGFSSNAQDTVIANATASRNGDYIVTANRNGCTAKDTVTVAVQPAPNAVTLSGNNPVCSGDTLYLNSTQSTTGASYTWAGPNSFSANTRNSFIANSTTAATGWYVMTVALGGCTYKDSLYATVNQTPALPNISYSSPLCVGETLNLSTTASGNYYWKGASNFTSNQQNPNRTNIQLGDTGSYSLAVTVNGCSSDTAYTHVNINPLPFVAIAASPGAAICSGQQVQFTAYPNQHGGTPGYQWYVNNIAVGNTTTVFTTSTLNNGDIVRCDMTEVTKCSSPFTDQSNDITMSVDPWLTPKVVISANPGPSIHPYQDITFTAIATDAGSNPTYQWKRNGINEAGATGSVWGANAQALSNGDDICVLVRSSYSCPQPDTVLSNCIELEVRLGVNGVVNNNGQIKIYPNPASTILHIEGAAAGSIVELVDLLGRKHATQQLVGTVVDVSALVPGVYIVRINGVVAGRVVKE